jgi:hypothetical protein
MITKYQLLKDNEDILFTFIKNGILSSLILRDIEIYNAFTKLEAKIKNNELRYAIIGDEYELSAKRVEQIVYIMQKEAE